MPHAGARPRAASSASRADRTCGGPAPSPMLHRIGRVGTARVKRSGRALGEPPLRVLERLQRLLAALPPAAAQWNGRLPGFERLVDLEEVPDLADLVHLHVAEIPELRLARIVGRH